MINASLRPELWDWKRGRGYQGYITDRYDHCKSLEVAEMAYFNVFKLSVSYAQSIPKYRVNFYH